VVEMCPVGTECVDETYCVNSGGRCRFFCEGGCCCKFDIIEVRSYSIPQVAYVGIPIRITVDAEIVNSSGNYDFYVGIVYFDGPANIISQICGEISAGSRCYAILPNRNRGIYTYEDYLTFQVEGEYIVMYIYGYIADGNHVGYGGLPIRINVCSSNEMCIRPTPTPMPIPTPTPMPGCGPLVRVGIDVLDRVVFCVGGVGVTVFILMVVFLLVWLLFKGR